MSGQYLRSLGLEKRMASNEVVCPDCDGVGFFASDNGPAPREIECESCSGWGVVEADEPEDEEDAAIVGFMRERCGLIYTAEDWA